MELRLAYQLMINTFPGGLDAMCAALNMTREDIENCLDERKGQAVLVKTALQMQSMSGTTHFAEVIAELSGGVFIKKPDHCGSGSAEFRDKFNELYAHLGHWPMSGWRSEMVRARE